MTCSRLLTEASTNSPTEPRPHWSLRKPWPPQITQTQAHHSQSHCHHHTPQHHRHTDRAATSHHPTDLHRRWPTPDPWRLRQHIIHPRQCRRCSLLRRLHRVHGRPPGMLPMERRPRQPHRDRRRTRSRRRRHQRRQPSRRRRRPPPHPRQRRPSPPRQVS